jgi:hypothetical protein
LCAPRAPPDAEEGDLFGPNRELYRALRGSKGDDPFEDEILWEGDFISTQREFLQKKEEEKLLERLQRRMGKNIPLALPNGLINVRRRWGQCHPQGANSGSNGKLELKANSSWLPPAHPYPLLANVYQASPFRPAMC